MSRGKKIIIGGGSGWIGTALGCMLRDKGYDVVNISRDPSSSLTWSHIEREGIPPDTYAVIQLAGASMIERRWNDERKHILYDSRVNTTKLLTKAILRSSNPPNVFVCMSAVGRYPGTMDSIFDEESTLPPSTHFAGRLCEDWEAAAQLPTHVFTRSVIIRTADVLGPGGGDLPYIVTHFKLGLGGPMGSGRQFYSWVSLLDACRLFVYAVEMEHVSGILNAISPQAVRNAEFAQVLAHVLWRPALVRAPSWGVYLVLGEMAQMVLEGAEVRPTRTLQTGFTFQLPDLERALRSSLDMP
eukprot:TRINITY_DN9608_c0_g1_i3.p1 TRINITY_DN9608_c0_g1~~TRINITY_DN9608_c0_g1_i3.p1  ORF type:complete len:299 (+),score=50.56 TRINITY_DN9608_c0_g1_i3:131-1027(+)